jgi:pSer/pThr/pTyr-binding forkhead associated (FHA) protein/thioredoxin reductase/ferredoxin
MPASSDVLADGTIITKEPVTLPSVLDLLIVGGGPGGTAAAFRAKELRLSALVIDYDDLMKRIREYAKDKLILPNFGGGDKMKFPKGGDVSSLLHFTDIDKDEMVRKWKGFYVQNNVPAQVGIELTGLQRKSDGVWDVKCWNHNLRSEQHIAAKHVVLCIGRGVPRRFDIPGNTDGIAYRLSDATNYVGAPSCVIGGGTSAAEAVIAISQSKIKGNDPTAVYWCYRGDKLPRVSKALAEVFFEAYMGNGNIRYFPLSDPVAVVTAEDRKDYLSIRTDRKNLPNRPAETHHLEFLKENCIACIGEDIPEALLNSMGIHMATGGPNNKKRMIVTPNLETQQTNVYLIGDILSQAYFEVDDFNSDPASYHEVTHRGNCKSAIRDGVYVANVIQQKLQGAKEVFVVLEEAEEEEEKKETPIAAVFKTMQKPVESAGPPKEAIQPERRVEESKARLVRILAENVQENEYPLKLNDITTIGRTGCDISIPEDNYLSEKHASILNEDGSYYLRDDGSATGVFLRVTEARPVELTSGTIILAGKQFLLFEVTEGNFMLHHFGQSGNELNRYQLAEKNYVMGREAPDITLDSGDLTLSRRHLAIYVKEKKVFIKDLKSANGTYLKVKTRMKLEPGDQFRVGKARFMLSTKEEALPRFATVKPGTMTIPRKEVPVAAAPAAAAPIAPAAKPAAAPAPAPAAAAAGEPKITFKALGKTVELKKGQSITEAAEEHGVKISAECHAGICGSDPIRILAGSEFLNEIGSGESDTLQDICGLKPGECRLACVTKPKGPVIVDIISQ